MDRAVETRRLILALVITAVYFVVEVVGGLLTNSLALLSDAGHMFSDAVALALSLFAFQMAKRPATTEKTYGYHRLEILAALFNGLTLWLIVGAIFHEAYRRLLSPPEVQSLGMLIVATVGLAVNVATGMILYASRQKSLNLRGAFLHVVGDALGSVGAIAAGLIMLSTGWRLADPLVSVLIGGIILMTSWGLVRESVGILMQWAPREIDVGQVQKAMVEVRGVVKVHDLHIWAVTTGVFTLSAHAVVDGEEDFPQVLNGIETILRDRFNIEHTTIQFETEDREDREFRDF
jgi:cobalt-zinc-cadmium efflux system protein